MEGMLQVAFGLYHVQETIKAATKQATLSKLRFI